jgi:excisionase family DNA binding protein
MGMMTPVQAAERLGVSPDTVVKWFDRGFLTGHRLPTGGRRIDPTSVAAVAADMERRGGGRTLTPAAWLDREILAGRLSSEPPAELIALAAQLVRASGIAQPPRKTTAARVNGSERPSGDGDESAIPPQA